MKRIILLLIGLAFLPATAQSLEKSLLWTISGNGLKAPSYLYGTIHMTCDNSLDATTQKAMDATQQLYLELDMDDPGMAMTMMMGINMKDGVTMDQLVSPADFAAADAFVKEKTGMPLSMMKTMKPFMVSAMLIPAMMGCTPKSVEEALMDIAKAQGEETLGLETVEEQMAVFDAIPYKIQMEELVKAAKDKASNDKKELEDLMATYAGKDVDLMAAMTEDSENRITSEYGDVLLKDRNANWIPKITKIAREKPTFFGVGAAHLGGENGVIRMLRKAGFTVEAVK